MADNGPVTTRTSSSLPRKQGRYGATERGATMVEFAIIAVWLFMLIFGVIEGAFAVRARNAINNAVDDAAREGAVAGTDADADFRIVNQLVQRGAVQAADVQYIVIYRASNSTDPISQSCADGTPTPNECNVYYPPFNLDPGAYSCPGGLGTTWCPADRVQGNDIGFLGVYVHAEHRPIVNQLLVEFAFDVDATSLQAIESSGARD